MDQHQRAHDIVTQFADADMSRGDIYALLVENDVPQEVAEEVAEDVRG